MMLSPRDWIERLRGARGSRAPVPSAAIRSAALPEVFGIPADVREVLLDLERRGQLRRALEMPPDRASLASHLAELLSEHGREAFLEALGIVDLHEEAHEEMASTRGEESEPLPAPVRAAPAVAAALPATPDATLPAEVITQLANLNVNQWRDERTDGWYGSGLEGRHELFVLRSAISPRLFKELATRGIVRREAQGVPASSAMTFGVHAGKLTFKGVIALDIEKLKLVTAASFDGIHSRWDAAARKYPVTVMRAEEVKHEPVT